MDSNDCFVIEHNKKDQFNEDVTYAMNKGYKVSSTNCYVTQTGEKLYQAIMVREQVSK